MLGVSFPNSIRCEGLGCLHLQDCCSLAVFRGYTMLIDDVAQECERQGLLNSNLSGFSVALASWIFPRAAWRGASGNRYRLPGSFLGLHGDKHMLLLVLAKDEDVIHMAKNTFLPHENLVHSLLLRGT